MEEGSFSCCSECYVTAWTMMSLLTLECHSKVSHQSGDEEGREEREGPHCLWTRIAERVYSDVVRTGACRDCGAMRDWKLPSSEADLWSQRAESCRDRGCTQVAMCF